MLNSLEHYREEGHKAGIARNERDEARSTFHRNWYRRARGLEQESDRDKIDQAFNEGYKQARLAPGFALLP